jgi:hypothetical protein
MKLLSEDPAESGEEFSDKVRPPALATQRRPVDR